MHGMGKGGMILLEGSWRKGVWEIGGWVEGAESKVDCFAVKNC